MRRLLGYLVCLVCSSVVVQVRAQEDTSPKAIEFLKAYSSFWQQDPSYFSKDLPTPIADDFFTESVFCTDIAPTTFELSPFETDVGRFFFVKRVKTDQGVLYVVFRERNPLEPTGDLVIAQVICEDSPSGQAFKALSESPQIWCGQTDPNYAWVQGHWANRQGDRQLIRLRSDFRSYSYFIYVKKEGEAWTYDKSICGEDQDVQALDLIAEYMYDYDTSAYRLGSRDTPVFAEITSSRGGYESGQATILIQLETFDKFDDKEKQDDPVCMIKLRYNDTGGWVLYEMRCISE